METPEIVDLVGSMKTRSGFCRERQTSIISGVVTTKRGELVGIARRGDLRRLIEESK